jgi:hypothetical protein
VSWAERRVTGPRGVSGPLRGSAGPSGERELGPRGIQLGQGLGLGLRVWVSFGFFLFYFYLLSHFKSKSNKG